MIKSFSKIPLKQKQRMLASFIILAFACIGVIGLIISHAATPFVSVEAESGTLTGPASVGSSTQASGSKYVQFGQTQTVADNKMLCIYTANSISAMNTLSEDMNTPIPK
jgi:hypothetical protein